MIKRTMLDVKPELLDEWDFENNADLDPYKLPPGSHHQAHFICKKCGYRWSTTIANRVYRGSGCPACAGRNIPKTKKSLAEYDPVVAAEWDYEENNGLTPEMFCSKANVFVKWKCGLCGYKWESSIYRRIGEKSSCPNCNGRVLIKGINDLQTLYPDIAKELITQRERENPSNISAFSKRLMNWKCSCCGEKWKARIRERTIENICCPKCGKLSRDKMAEIDWPDTSIVFPAKKEKVVNQ